MKTILFDLDGTITNPQEGILNCIRYALDKLNVPSPSEDVLKTYIGPSLWESFKEMLNTDSQDDATEAVMLYRERFSTVGKFENSPYDGIFDTLENLNAKGYTLYICTSKPGVYAKDIAKHFKFHTFFKEIYGSNLDGSLVDKSQLIEHILSTEGIAPSETAMIGDRKYDIIGAANNGLSPYGVLYGFGDAEELSDAIATFKTPSSIATHF